jgi:hypothetical protein
MFHRIAILLLAGVLTSVVSLAGCTGAEPAAQAPQETAHDYHAEPPAPPVSQSSILPSLPTPASQVESVRPAQPEQPAVWPDDPLFVVQSDALSIFSMATGKERTRLPAGSLSADGKRYFAVRSATASPKVSTTIAEFEPATGRALRDFSVDGRWAISRVSYSGRWLVLSRIATAAEKASWTKTGKWVSDFLVVDADNGKTAHTIHLDGAYEADTTSRDGNWLFLIQHVPPEAPEHYVIRLYDLAKNHLIDGVLRDKTATEDIMTGLAWNGLASPNGRWLLTLYLNTGRNVAFIHSLDLVDNFPVCIDLPSDRPGSVSASESLFDLLRQYTLTISPNGEKLYAVNAALGVVAHIDLYSRQVVRTERFANPSFAAPFRATITEPLPQSVIAPDGLHLYFTNGWDVWQYDTIRGKVDGPFLSDALVKGLGVSSDGLRVYIAAEGKPLAVFDVRDGRRLHFPTTTARTP